MSQTAPQPDITGGNLGAPLVSARSAEIYPWGEGRIVKLFRPGFCADTARREWLNAREAHACQATAIECLEKVEIDGRLGIVMNRIEGTTLTAAADANPWRILSVPRTLARLHVQVHAARTDRLEDIRDVIVAFLDHTALAFLSEQQKSRARSYVRRLPAGNTLLHMDFHTENVLVSRHAETVIDWATAAQGHVGADQAMTCFLFHEAELFPGITRAQTLLYNTLRRFIYRRYLKHYIALGYTSAVQVKSQIAEWYLAILIWRLAMWSAPTEIEPLRQKIIAGIDALPDGLDS